MNKIDYQKPGNIEKKILQILSERDHFDFMNLRASFPLKVTSVEKRCNDLISLGLITKEKINNETKYSITDLGAQVMTQGLDKWIKHKVFNEIRNQPYVITKSTPGLERLAVRNLESDGKIYFDGKLYKIVPGQNLELQKTSIDIRSVNLNGIIDDVLTDIYTGGIPFHNMEMEKTHKHEVRHAMNYLEEHKLVDPYSDPIKLTPLGIHVYNIGHDKWRIEKDREELHGEKIKNAHLQNILSEKSKKTWKTKINDWYTENEKVINIILGIVAILSLIASFI